MLEIRIGDVADAALPWEQRLGAALSAERATALLCYRRYGGPAWTPRRSEWSASWTEQYGSVADQAPLLHPGALSASFRLLHIVGTPVRTSAGWRLRVASSSTQSQAASRGAEAGEELLSFSAFPLRRMGLAVLQAEPVDGPPQTLASLAAGFRGCAQEMMDGGANAVLGADQPVLAVHRAMLAAGGDGNVLRPGSLAVIAKPRDALGGTLSVQPDLGLCLDDGHGPRQLTGVDYLVLRIECRAERDDWRFPELDSLIRAAGEAAINGYAETFRDRRTEAITRAWNSPDLTPVDRHRVAMLVAGDIDAARKLGAVPRQSLADAADARLPAADAPEMRALKLTDLISRWRGLARAGMAGLREPAHSVRDKRASSLTRRQRSG